MVDVDGLETDGSVRESCQQGFLTGLLKLVWSRFYH